MKHLILAVVLAGAAQAQQPAKCLELVIARDRRNRKSKPLPLITRITLIYTDPNFLSLRSKPP